MRRIIVERRFEQKPDFDALQAQENAVAWCLEQHRVRFIRSYFSKDRRTMICEYEAPDAEAVRSVQRASGLPYQRIWSAEVFEWTEDQGEAPEG